MDFFQPNMLTRWSVERFRRDPNQPRKEFDELALRALGLSIKVMGQLQPVGAKPDGMILWGERRVLAARLVGIEDLAVVVADRVFNEVEIRSIQLSENYHRESLSGWELYLAAKGMKEGDPPLTNRELARMLAVDESTVSLWLAPDRCIEPAKQALEQKVISLKEAVKLSRLTADRQPGVLALMLSNSTPATVTAACRKAPEASSPKVERVRCPLPGGVQVTVAGRAVDIDGLIAALAESLELVKRCKRDGLQVDTISRVLADRAKAQGGGK